jgi:hypothetical protein
MVHPGLIGFEPDFAYSSQHVEACEFPLAAGGNPAGGGEAALLSDASGFYQLSKIWCHETSRVSAARPVDPALGWAVVMRGIGR